MLLWSGCFIIIAICYFQGRPRLLRDARDNRGGHATEAVVGEGDGRRVVGVVDGGEGRAVGVPKTLSPKTPMVSDV